MMGLWEFFCFSDIIDNYAISIGMALSSIYICQWTTIL